jgi:ribA/ribD-fused uncharacterized protein
MQALISTSVLGDLKDMISIAQKDTHAELEVKVLSGLISTKDVADRVVKAIESMTTGSVTEEHRASFSYADGLRVNVVGAENIHKVCVTGTFRGVPLKVERKRRYFDTSSGKDVLEVPDMKLRFTLRHEEQLRKDFSGSPMDASNHLRILHRKSWKTADGLFQIDMSLVKTKQKGHKTFADVLKQVPSYELEVELIRRDAPVEKILDSLMTHVEPLVAAYQESPFLLTDTDIQRYRMEFEASKIRFVNPVTMERRYLRADRPNNILTGYTVTNKADGERSFLVVTSDKRLVRITPSGKITWTGITTTKDNHIGDTLDGEYLADRNLFCIFDVYQFRGKSTLRLPLMTTDDDIVKNPLKSRLGCAHQFIADMKKDFLASFARNPFRIETKMFLAGNGPTMEKAIQTILDTKFEYPTDGLIFTPKDSPVAPVQDRKGDVWLRVYKWKPASQNSIDFLLRYKPGESYDPVLGERVVRGTLYVSRTPGTDIVYPCETITGEYKPPILPADLQVISETRDRVPSPFQPSIPKAPDASEILLKLNSKGVPIDEVNQKIEDNTIIECVRDVDHGRWKVLRTRYDKTYQYRVLGRPQFGNDIHVAENIWTNIHNPVTEEMIRNITTSPPDDTFEDDLYYRDSLEARDRVLRDVYSFHNKIKERLYQANIKAGDTLLELAVGRGGDLHKWRKTKPSKIVGIDLSASNLESTKQGACVRYIQESKKSKLPPVLFIQGDMTQSLMQQENRYLKMLDKREPATTPYLEQFVGLTEFDVVSCQFAIHYACESEETFRKFVGNLTAHCKSIFFGTCMDGAAVYSLLLGKQTHIFRANNQVFGEVSKEYEDGASWTEDFGRTILVKLESFEKPQKEYLVPFGKVTEILKENGFELANTTTFSDEYAGQTEFIFSAEHQAFSFLHRSFTFKRVERKPEPVPEVKISTIQEVEAEKKEEAPAEKKEEEKKEEKPKKKKIVKKIVVEAAEPPEIIYFFTGSPELNANREFSNMFEAPMQIDGITFPTVEHYYQWSKAKVSGDEEAATKIMKTASPKSVKAYGKKVKNLDKEKWEEKKNDIMRIALKAKFSQHPELRKKLQDTGTKLLAEANPRDKYWGIGTSHDTSKAKDPNKWPGKNVMGNMLQELRTTLSA